MEHKSGFTFKRMKDQMIEALLDDGIKDFRVLDAMSKVERHKFVDEALWSRAYENRSLSIGHRQTISQPYIVARMTELLIQRFAGRGLVMKNVLEIGSGCGYQSAVLAQLSENVLGLERIKPLVRKSRINLLELRISNVKIKHADGFQVANELEQCFDGILCASAPRDIPIELIPLLKKDANLVIPVGSSNQTLTVVTKKSKQNYITEEYDKVSFVPMLGGKTNH